MKIMDSSKIQAYINAGWAGSTTGRRSAGGYRTFVKRILVTWRSMKQNLVLRSQDDA
jgi:hypothetical protein